MATCTDPKRATPQALDLTCGEPSCRELKYALSPTKEVISALAMQTKEHAGSVFITIALITIDSKRHSTSLSTI